MTVMLTLAGPDPDNAGTDLGSVSLSGSKDFSPSIFTLPAILFATPPDMGDSVARIRGIP